jgi:glycosyltransferase involved in cell wall biosynthesis
MRILMIWSENLNKPGGGKTHFVNLARELAVRGHTVRIVAPGYPPRTTEDLGVPVSYVPTFRRSTAAFALFHLLLAAAMPWFLLRYRPAVVFTRGLFHSFLIFLICRLFGCAYVAGIDSMAHYELEMRGLSRITLGLVRLADRLNLRWASAFICVTEGLRQEMIRRGNRPERVVAIHNGAEVGVFVPGDQAAARRKLGLPAEAVLVGFVGTLSVYQGLDLLIDAAAQCPDGERPVRFVIVGSGDRHGEVVEHIERSRQQERFLLRPAVSHEAVREYLDALDVEVICVHDERTLRYGLSSLKFWEALAVGLPILVPDASGLGDVLAELKWPAVYRTGDAADLAAVLQRVIADLPRLRTRRQELHDTACRRHSWAAVAEATEIVFERLAGGLAATEAGA